MIGDLRRKRLHAFSLLLESPKETIQIGSQLRSAEHNGDQRACVLLPGSKASVSTEQSVGVEGIRGLPPTPRSGGNTLMVPVCALAKGRGAADGCSLGGQLCRQICHTWGCLKRHVVHPRVSQMKLIKSSQVCVKRADFQISFLNARFQCTKTWIFMKQPRWDCEVGAQTLTCHETSQATGSGTTPISKLVLTLS